MNFDSFSDISWDLLHAPAPERKMYVEYFRVMDELLSGTPVKDIDFSGMPAPLALRSLVMSGREDMFDAQVNWLCEHAGVASSVLSQDDELSFVAQYLLSPEHLVQWVPSRSTSRAREEAKEIQEKVWSLALQSQVLAPTSRVPTYMFGKKEGTLGALSVAMFSPHLPQLWSRIESQSNQWNHTEMAQAICMAINTRKRWKVHTLGSFEDHDATSSTSPSPFQYVLSSVLSHLDWAQVDWDMKIQGRTLLSHVFCVCVELLDDLAYWDKQKTKKQMISLPPGVKRFMEFVSTHDQAPTLMEDPSSFGQISCWRLLMSKSTPEKNSALLKSWLKHHQNDDILFFPFTSQEHVLSRTEGAEVLSVLAKECTSRLSSRADDQLLRTLNWLKKTPKPILGELADEADTLLQTMINDVSAHKKGQEKFSYPREDEITRLTLKWITDASALHNANPRHTAPRKM